MAAIYVWFTVLQSDEVGDCFAFNFFENLPNDKNIVAFADYLADNYISEDARFAPSIWT